MNQPAYSISDHAIDEAKRRGIPFFVLQSVIESPQQIVDVQQARKAYQSKIEIDGEWYVVRVIIEMSNPMTIITVYRTSKIKKYWSDET
jgi:hypothetical protein